MRDFISVLKSRVGKKEAGSADEILSKVLSERQASAVISTNLERCASGSDESLKLIETVPIILRGKSK